MERYAAGLLLCLLIAPAGGCGGPSEADCLCTRNLVFVQVAVVDANGSRIDGLTPVITIVRTGQPLALSRVSSSGVGYNVITDHEKEQIRASSERLMFSVSDGTRSAEAEFVVRFPGSCGCHVEKVSGPSTIVLQ